MAIKKKRVLLKVSYDGRAYDGWKNDSDNTIEESLKKAILSLTNEEVEIISFENTEPGVSAECNLAVFETASGIPGHQFAHYLNEHLPEDIVVIESEEHLIDWQPWRYGTERTYAYYIYNEEMRNPMRRQYAFHCHYQLNLVEMQDSAAYLRGEHDMTTFTDDDPEDFGRKCVCNISEISINAENPPAEEFEEDDDLNLTNYYPSAWRPEKELLPDGIGNERTFNGMIKVSITSDKFYKNMMVIIVGCLLNVGTDIWQAQKMQKAMDDRDRLKAAEAAPKIGLMLENVNFIKKMI